MNDASAIGGIVLGIVIVVGLFFLLRELFCWYWKINQLIKIQQTMLETQLKMFEKQGGAVNWDAVNSIIGK
ncbi:MAG: hypothetical protein WCK18_14360 [Prolixibacteraceae bacterium]